ncbi:MAG: hypothetical protein IRY97_12125 [Thermomicrobiaceae bacterium]|nr:hypothetical protein [Thermomicrobiaceae bacterium]
MRSNRSRAFLADALELESRPLRRGKSAGVDLSEARRAWEEIVCPHCNADHPDTLTVRMRRVGSEIEARCSHCGGVAARYIDGVWSS